ncbi:MAG: hypothetical protein OXF76_03910 [Caldilineaceae bacterium]|nr:hypothetical protein [Caldilineaceae bacterium]
MVLLALALFVISRRLFRLYEVPLGLISDSGIHGVDSLRVLDGEHAIVFPAYTPREGVFVCAAALSTALWGRKKLALHLPGALASAGTVFVVLWLGQLLLGRNERTGQPAPWRGYSVGLEGLSAYADALSTTLLGRGVPAIRRPSVAAAAGAFFTVFWLGKAFFGEDENGITISLCGQLVAGVTLLGAELSGLAHS